MREKSRDGDKHSYYYLNAVAGINTKERKSYLSFIVDSIYLGIV